MQTLLKNENNDIEALTKDIEDAKKSLEPIQKEIDAGKSSPYIKTKNRVLKTS